MEDTHSSINTSKQNPEAGHENPEITPSDIELLHAKGLRQLPDLREYLRTIMRADDEYGKNALLNYICAGPEYRVVVRSDTLDTSEPEYELVPVSEYDPCTLPKAILDKLLFFVQQLRAALPPASDKTPHAEN